MNRSAFIPILLVVALLLATAPVLAQSAILDPLLPQDQIVLGAPNWNFGPDVAPNISTYDHRRMVVSEGCNVDGDGFDDILVAAVISPNLP